MFLLLLGLLLNPPAFAGDGKGLAFLDEVLTVYREANSRAQARVAEVGEGPVLEGLATDALEYQHPGLGRAKVVSVEGELSIRVVHQASGIAFLFLDQDRISPESPSLRRYLAKQHLDAGHREVRPQNGRDVVYVWLKDTELVGTDHLPRNKKFTRDWWRDYGLATLAKPTAGDIVLGSACGLVYGGLAACVSALNHVLTGAPMNWEPAAFTAAWSMLQGTFVQTFSNSTLRGTPGMQRLNFAMQGLAFNYSLAILSQGWAHTLNIFDPHALLAQLQVWGNVALNSYASVELREPLALRYRSGITADPIKIPLPNGKHIAMDRYATERNFVGVFTFPLTLLDVTGVSNLPLGKMALISMVPMIRRFTLWYSGKIGSSEAEIYQARWESWLPARIWEGLKETVSKPVEVCRTYLAKKRRDGE